MEEKIPELEKIYSYEFEADPLLEYAAEMMDNDCIDDFLERYREGLIDQSREEKYLKHDDVKKTLKAFGLDREKFWYLCLMLKDVMDIKTQNIWIPPKDPCDELKEMLELLRKVSPQNQGELSLSVGNETATASNRRTMEYITEAMEKALEKAEKELHREIQLPEGGKLVLKQTGFLDEKTTLAPIYRIAIFHKLLMHFLKDKKPRKDRKDINASKDKMMLVSRMIYILGISDDERYNQEWIETGDKLNFLKYNIRRYQKGDKLNNILNAYTIYY